MADDREIEDKFWSALESSSLMMLGIEGARDGATQPMMANFEDQDREAGLLWFFTAKDHDFIRAMGQSNKAICAYSAKGHDLFASLRGSCRSPMTPQPSSGCGARSWPNGTRGRTIRSWRFCGSTSRTRRSG